MKSRVLGDNGQERLEQTGPEYHLVLFDGVKYVGKDAFVHQVVKTFPYPSVSLSYLFFYDIFFFFPSRSESEI